MKDWSGNKTAVYVTNGDSSHSTRERETRDYYATDPRAVTELLKRETFCNEILEPACGGGARFRNIKAQRLRRSERGHSKEGLQRARLHGGLFARRLEMVGRHHH